jgi:hypothetical protein
LIRFDLHAFWLCKVHLCVPPAARMLMCMLNYVSITPEAIATTDPPNTHDSTISSIASFKGYTNGCRYWSITLTYRGQYEPHCFGSSERPVHPEHPEARRSWQRCARRNRTIAGKYLSNTI